MGCCSFRGAPCFCFAFNLPTHGSRLRFSSISPGRHSESNPHSQAGHYRRYSLTPTSAPWSRPTHPPPRCSQWRSFSHPRAAAPHSRPGRAGASRGKVPPSCLRKTALPLKSPTGAFIAAQLRHFAFRRKQKIRTLLLSRKGSDFHCLVRWKGLEPPAY